MTKYIYFKNKSGDEPNKLKIGKDLHQHEYKNWRISVGGSTLEEAQNELHNPSCQDCGQKLGIDQVFYTSAHTPFKAAKEIILCKNCYTKREAAKAL